ncbi:hypothetical protein [Lacisediminimonas sp.]|uniref:hypothetical protein n=1 Tax=Lacisediminimonas sp. TaxID=3060582 RepID=UPI002717C5BD|nr:hypothetical protein [Lacisediminimonas sp.]MDO8299455.1 hypothetical protein [Lacisediminimonas sp.]MDO9217411.1 hypothetical protein [Lacisediminimonas sp.]
MNRQSIGVACLAGMLLLAGCDSKSPERPGNPLPPQKPPAPKLGGGAPQLAQGISPGGTIIHRHTLAGNGSQC